MYTMCAFETSWDRHNKSAWCKIFKKSELKVGKVHKILDVCASVEKIYVIRWIFWLQVLEYAEDLELYWFDGYGKELNTKIACPMFKDAFAHLR